MSANTIALVQEPYSPLRRAKRPGETFSDVIHRELGSPSRISDSAGSLSEVPEKTWMEL